ncbi:MAG TPA: hypothetical protein VMM83_07945, partial [Longimicrobiales bacterium]|nr:hypothetical protein [Longimicrobiales bacterium]
ALRTLESGGPDDRFWLIRAGASWEPAVSGDAALVAEAVRRTEATPAGADLAAEIERAGSILAGEPDGRAREIHVLSDLQATGLVRIPAVDQAPPIIALDPGTAAPANLGLADIQVGGGLPPRSGERSTIAATVTTSSPADDPGDEGRTPDSVAVRLVLDGAVRAAATVVPGATVILPFPARPAGVVAGRVELDADALTDDDRRHFVAHVTPPPSVGLTEPQPFLMEAVGVLVDAGRIRRAAPANAEIVIAPGALGAEAVRQGRGVVVLPPASVLELAASNQRLATAGIPWRFAPPTPGEARIMPEAGDLGEVLREARLRQTYPLERQGAPGDSTLLRLLDGEPWAVVGELPSGGRYVLLGTPLTPEGGTIPTSETMLPLLDRAISAWATAGADPAELVPGDVVTLPAGDSLVGPADPARQAGRARIVAPVPAGTVHRLTETGLYRLVRDGETVAAYAVNPPASESDLTRVSPDRLGDLLTGREVTVAGAGAWEEAIYLQRVGREISWPLALLALLALVVESALAAAGRGAPRTGRASAVAAAPTEQIRTASGEAAEAV